MRTQPNSNLEKMRAGERVPWFVELPPQEVLEMRGSDGLDLLQRISTNDLARMQAGSWTRTVLTNEKGRMIDLLWIGMIQKDRLFLVSGARSLEKTKEWIDKFIIMEDVQLSFLKETHMHLLVAGKTDFAGEESFMQFEEQWGKTVFLHILTPEERLQPVVGMIRRHGLQERSVEEYEEYRISEGIPRASHEIVDEFNPLEAGLGHLISWNKGCYVGQEVIARLDTYKKVQKRLARLSLSGDVVLLPARIHGSAGEVGTLTSVTSREPFMGLGYVAVSRPEGKGEMFVENGKDHIRVTLKD